MTHTIQPIFNGDMVKENKVLSFTISSTNIGSTNKPEITTSPEELEKIYDSYYKLIPVLQQLDSLFKNKVIELKHLLGK